ncbi:hypothetical protein CANARDRAFT_180471, partial [[Candida] arabinofermentans NRRL YB-2248]
MTKYTEEELLTYKEHARLPSDVDLSQFNELISKVKEILKEQEESGNLRRKSFGTLQQQRPKKNKIRELKQTDDDGWTSFVAPKAPKKLSDVDSEDLSKGKQHTIKVKTSSSKISSGKASNDARDNVTIAQVSKFNAFDALGDDDDD